MYSQIIACFLGAFQEFQMVTYGDKKYEWSMFILVKLKSYLVKNSLCVESTNASMEKRETFSRKRRHREAILKTDTGKVSVTQQFADMNY